MGGGNHHSHIKNFNQFFDKSIRREGAKSICQNYEKGSKHKEKSYTLPVFNCVCNFFAVNMNFKILDMS